MYNLTVDDHNTLIEYCEEIGIQYLCTPFCRYAVDVLDDLGVVAFKTGSGELTNSIMMDRIIDIGKPLIMSTGMCAIEELDDVVKTIKQSDLDLVIMNCTSIYPAPYSKINLNLIPLYQQRYDVFVGHSDHTPDIWTSIAAVALGACVVEKHFTLNRSMRGPDYQVSLEPSEFMQMVEGANKVFEARGQDKLIHDEEVAVREWAHHSLVAKTNISKGEKILSTSLDVKRPGTGIPAKFIDKLESRSAREQIPAGTIIKWEHLFEDSN
jgi:N-acetylneuraminate synthase